jgi:hypothetical protein
MLGGGSKMKQRNRWTVLVLILIAFLQLAACNPNPQTGPKEEPAHIVPIEGTDVSRIELTAKAAERIDLKAVLVREELVVRKRTFGGVVVDTIGSALVRVAMDAGDQGRVDENEPAIIRAMEPSEAAGWMGQVVAAPDPSEATEALYCLIDTDQTSFVDGQRVYVEVSMKGSGEPQKIVPYASVLYDLYGEAWVYTRLEPLAFVRAPIVVDYIDDDLAVLFEGPPAGTEVVTDGASELYGAETGIGGGGH